MADQVETKEPVTESKAEPKADAKAAEPNPDLVAAREEAKKAREEADRAKGLLVRLAQRLQSAPAAPEPEENDDDARARLKQAIEEDPEGVLDQHFNARMAPILKDRYEQDARMLKEREIEKIVAKHGKDEWNKYKDQVDEFMGNMSLTTKANPGAWERAYDFVRLQHVDDIVEAKVQERMNRDKQMATETGSSVGTRRPSKAPLSALEADIMKEYDMTDEEWRKYGGGTAMSEGEIE